MGFIKILWLIGLCTMNIQAYTHWMVTENGLIQPKIDSPFEMAQPYDLLTFLNQDTRWQNIFKIYDNLVIRQQIIDKLWTDMEVKLDMDKIKLLDENCVKAGELTSFDWYIAFLEDGKSKGIKDDEFMLYNFNHGDKDVPDCKKISSLTFSMFAFEHLEGMIKRDNLTSAAEISLPELVAPIMTLDQFGHWLTASLKKNSTSWLHYNLASLYWRVRGNAPKAVECSRRAIYYSPRRYKDVALLSLGTTLHRSKMTDDAIIVLEAASHHEPDYPITHFMLANAYAVSGDYDNTLKHFDKSLKLSSNSEIAEKYKNGILCYMFLSTKLQTMKETFNLLKEQLAEYNERDLHWLRSQTALLKAMKHKEEHDYKNVDRNCEIISEITGLNIKPMRVSGEQNSLIEYFLDGPFYKRPWVDAKGVRNVEAAYSLQSYIKDIGIHVDKKYYKGADFVMEEVLAEVEKGIILKEVGPLPAFPEIFPDLKVFDKIKMETQEEKKESHKSDEKNQQSPSAYEDMKTGTLLYPTWLKINRNKEDFDVEPEWPSNRLCNEADAKFPESLQDIFPVFMPFENKGLKITSLLSDKIGVPVSVEHELPWHPPICPHDKHAAAYSHKKPQKPQIMADVVTTEYLRDKLLEYVGAGNIVAARRMQDAEIGHRIYAAMQMKIAPKWLLYTLSSLYWRVRDNNINALHCLLAANKKIEGIYRDLVHVSLASVYLEMGYFDEALAAAEEAYKLNMYEPDTNFILAQLNMIKKHRSTHMFHLKQVLRVDPNYMDGVARDLLNGWACLVKQFHKFHEIEFSEGDVCTQVEPGMSMVCDRDGSNCHVSNIQCFSNQDHESSTLVRMLELKNDNIQSASLDRMDDMIFDEFANNIPVDRTDKVSHQKQYDAIMDTVVRYVKSCNNKGCWNFKAKNLALTHEDCSNQHLQLGYWLQIISFRQLITDPDLRVPPEILSITPTSKQFPECRLPAVPLDDFFIEKMLSINTEGWEAVLSLMHQFSEINAKAFDYTTFGAKIARYVDTHPSSWLGLVAAGWWCGSGGFGACAVRCFAAAHVHAPAKYASYPLTSLAALLHIQTKPDAKKIAYLAFYASPKNKIGAFLVALSHTTASEYEIATWMYRYTLELDGKYLPAKAYLHATMCLMFFGDTSKMSNHN